MDLSIIYAVYNSEKTLRKSLESSLRQKTDYEYEIIVVNNNSNDKTDEIIQQVANEYPDRMLSLTEPRQGRLFALQAGCRMASGTIVSMVDDDNFLDSRFVQNICDYFFIRKMEKCGIVGVYSKAVFEENEPDWFSHYQAHFACGPQASEAGVVSKTYVYGAGMSIRRELLEEIFSEPFMLGGRIDKYYISGEDSEIAMKVLLKGFWLYYNPEARLEHFMRKERMTRAYLKKLICGNAMALPIVLGYYMKIRRFPIQMNRFTAWLFFGVFFFRIPFNFLKKKITSQSAGLEDFYQFIGYYKGMLYFSKYYTKLK